TAYCRTERQLRSLCETTFAMLRWTNTCPGGSPTIWFAGTRLSEHPIQRYFGDCPRASAPKNSGSAAAISAAQARLRSNRSSSPCTTALRSALFEVLLQPEVREDERCEHGAEPHDHRGGDPGVDAADGEAVGDQRRDDERHERGDQSDAAEYGTRPPAEHADEEGLEQREDDREDRDRHDETGHGQRHAVEHGRSHDQPDRVGDEGDQQPHEKPDHACTRA